MTNDTDHELFDILEQLGAADPSLKGYYARGTGGYDAPFFIKYLYERLTKLQQLHDAEALTSRLEEECNSEYALSLAAPIAERWRPTITAAIAASGHGRSVGIQLGILTGTIAEAIDRGIKEQGKMQNIPQLPERERPSTLTLQAMHDVAGKPYCVGTYHATTSNGDLVIDAAMARKLLAELLELRARHAVEAGAA